MNKLIMLLMLGFLSCQSDKKPVVVKDKNQQTIDSLVDVIKASKNKVKKISNEKKAFVAKNKELEKRTAELSYIEKVAYAKVYVKENSKHISEAAKTKLAQKIQIIKSCNFPSTILKTEETIKAFAICAIVEGADGGNVKCWSKHNHESNGCYHRVDDAKTHPKGSIVYKGKRGFWFVKPSPQLWINKMSKHSFFSQCLAKPKNTARDIITTWAASGYCTIPTTQYLSIACHYGI